MTKISRSILAALIVGILIIAVTGCEKKEGPMERTGREMDKATEKSGQQINKAVEKTGEKIEKAGDKVRDSVR